MIGAKRLREAACQAEKTFLVGLPEPEDCKAVFSSKFQREMKYLVRRTDHPILYRVVNAALWSLLAVLLAGSSVLAFSPTARTALTDWVREGCPLSFSAQDASAAPAAEAARAPRWLPEGFSAGAQFASDGYTCVVFDGAEGNYIVLAYTEDAESASVAVRREGLDVQTVPVGELSGELYTDPQGGANALVWSDGEGGKLFWLYGSCSGEDLIRIAENMPAQIQK